MIRYRFAPPQQLLLGEVRLHLIDPVTDQGEISLYVPEIAINSVQGHVHIVSGGRPGKGQSSQRTTVILLCKYAHAVFKINIELQPLPLGSTPGDA
tara:strand:- start:386 stop:673 length:288 start_codon:yes stop_codon:yes gene_type:complete